MLKFLNKFKFEQVIIGIFILVAVGGWIVIEWLVWLLG